MGIRFRLTLWLFIVLTPIIVGGSLALNSIDTRVSERIVADLTNTLDLETSRISNALSSLTDSAELLGTGPSLVAALDPSRAATVNPDALVDRPINAAEALLDFTRDARLRVEAVRVLSRDGSEVATSEEVSWTSSAGLAAEAMEIRRPIVGAAFEASPGDERLGVAAPVVSSDGSVVGALLLEYRLSSVTEFVHLNERYSETSEVSLLQRSPEDTVEFITRPRFARDQIFGSSGDLAELSPAAQSLVAGAPQIIQATDYRGIDTIAAVGHIEQSGWGIVAKMDVDEAFALRSQVERYALLAAGAVAATILVGWLFLVRPLGRRLRRAAEAVDRVMSGDRGVEVDDHGSDEVGHLTRSIDDLAADLAHDRRIRATAEERLRWRTEHDVLTGLVNRSYAMQIMEGYAQANTRYGVLFLDLDGFKQVNDSHGHMAGDEVLQIISRRLETAASPGATVARWGGDEFLVIVADADVDQIGQLRLAFGDALAQPSTTSAGTHHVGGSIGIANSDQDSDPAAVLHKADAAMFRLKHTRSSYRKISPAAIRMVEAALAEDRVEAYLQPVVDVEGGSVKLHGAEALVRIRSEDGALVMPGEFLDALGTGALAVAVDLRVLSLSLEAVGRWRKLGLIKTKFTLAVNLGNASMSHPDIVHQIGGLLDECGVPASFLQIEIPETVEEPSTELLNAFRKLGLELAIDDVGCQYSNLERLVDVSADVAKIDRRWIPMDSARSQQHELLAGLIDQCQTLDFTVIAEGIETERQLELLTAMGVSRFQGYFFGRPQPIVDLEIGWLQGADLRKVGEFAVAGAG